MKKIFAFILVILMYTMSSGYSYHQKCRKCQREQRENKTCMCEIGIAWRDFSVPVETIDGKPYAVYRCCYGHSYKSELK